MKKTLLIPFLILLFSFAHGQIKYPESAQGSTVDNYFGTQVKDPYRWLEDDNSQATKAWVIAQNKVTQEYLSKIPFRDKVKKRLEEMWNYPKYSSPFKEGQYYYFYKNDGLQNQSVLYRQLGINGSPEVFIDPNKMSSDGTAAVSTPIFSKSKKYAAYMIAQSGSDWQVGYVMDVATKKVLGDKLNWIKFSGISWKGDDGFYYSRFPPSDEKNKMTNANQNQKIYYHHLGDAQSKDELVYEDKAHPFRFIGGGLTEDQRFLVVYTSEGTSGAELWVKDLKKVNQDFTLLVKGFDTEASVIDNNGDRLLVLTNADAPNYQVVSVDPQKPQKENWKVIIPTRSKLLQSVSTAGNKLFLSYLEDASTRVYQTNYDGVLEREIKLPGIGSAGGFSGYKDDKEIFFSYTSFNYPPAIFRYDITTGTTSLFHRNEIKLNVDDFETVQSFFTSKDGTKVPMFITYKKGLQLNGQNPTIVYGYGGFNVALTPFFSTSTAFFLEQGGVLSIINLRGGNEYGEEWHKAGMLKNKQNVFDDFIAGLEFLVKTKYTNPEKLAVWGGSNGGLLIGAVMTQRPELFKVAIPEVGVMDMLRYHKFTIGHAWATEYGSSEKQEEFNVLYKYSPLHNLKPGVHYPATLITTADHDDRVVPAHSFKFAATLQHDADPGNPALIRIDSKAGHGGGKPTSKQIDEAADIWSFVMYNLGMQFKD